MKLTVYGEQKLPKTVIDSSRIVERLIDPPHDKTNYTFQLFDCDGFAIDHSLTISLTIVTTPIAAGHTVVMIRWPALNLMVDGLAETNPLFLFGIPLSRPGGYYRSTTPLPSAYQPRQPLGSTHLIPGLNNESTNPFENLTIPPIYRLTIDYLGYLSIYSHDWLLNPGFHSLLATDLTYHVNGQLILDSNFSLINSQSLFDRNGYIQSVSNHGRVWWLWTDNSKCDERNMNLFYRVGSIEFDPERSGSKLSVQSISQLTNYTNTQIINPQLIVNPTDPINLIVLWVRIQDGISSLQRVRTIDNGTSWTVKANKDSLINRPIGQFHSGLVDHRGYFVIATTSVTNEIQVHCSTDKGLTFERIFNHPLDIQPFDKTIVHLANCDEGVELLIGHYRILRDQTTLIGTTLMGKVSRIQQQVVDWWPTCLIADGHQSYGLAIPNQVRGASLQLITRAGQWSTRPISLISTRELLLGPFNYPVEDCLPTSQGLVYDSRRRNLIVGYMLDRQLLIRVSNTRGASWSDPLQINNSDNWVTDLHLSYDPEIDVLHLTWFENRTNPGTTQPMGAMIDRGGLDRLSGGLPNSPRGTSMGPQLNHQIRYAPIWPERKPIRDYRDHPDYQTYRGQMVAGLSASTKLNINK